MTNPKLVPKKIGVSKLQKAGKNPVLQRCFLGVSRCISVSGCPFRSHVVVTPRKAINAVARQAQMSGM